MPWWQQLGWCFVASDAAITACYVTMWRHYLPGGKYDTP